MGFVCAMFKGDFLLFMDLLRFAADFFEKTALGELGEPNNTYLGDINLFKNDEKMSSFYLNHRKLQGQFDKHFYSSIPFILEEECRVGSALKDYLEKRDSI